MKTFRLLVLLICTNGWATELSGEISGYLPAEDSPYYITGDLIITDSLVVEAGCVFYTNPNCKIATGIDESNFNAYIRAEGTETDSIIFTDNPNDSIMAWGGISLGYAPENTSIFTFCRIENGSPVDGGNNYLGNGIHAFSTNLIINHSIIQNNRVSHFSTGGAGIEAIHCKLILSNSIIQNNSDIVNDYMTHGAGVSLFSHEEGTTINNCIIYNNSGSNWGGGIEIAFGSIELIIENTIIANNSAWRGAGASIIFNSNPVFRNCIFHNNENSQLSSGPEYETIYADGEFTIESSILDEELCHWFQSEGGSGDPWGYGCDHPDYDFVNVDPMFVDADNGDFRLLPQSPAINAGTGDPDPDGSPPDIGPIYFHLTKGDVNFDEQINIMDIITGVQFILLISEPWNSQAWSFDYNDNGILNVADIIQIVNLILEEGLF